VRPPAPQPRGPDWQRLLASLGQTARAPGLRDFYQSGCVSADTPLAEVPLVALDVETTGLDPRRHSIVSIGLMPFDLQRIRCADAWYRVVRPDTPLSPESVTFHRITHSEISQAPSLDEVMDELLQQLRGKVMVVHYRTIERGFLDMAARRRFAEGLQFPLIDSMELEARLHRGRRQPGMLARLLGRQPASIRLADSRLRYGLPLYPAHHALSDALATAELLQAQVATHFDPQQPVRNFWS